jgi:hypothetical protein
VTERAALVVGEGYYHSTGRGSDRYINVVTWPIELEAAGPDGRTRHRIQLRNQDGRIHIRSGTQITVRYLAGEAAWIRLGDGTTLRTEDHPRHTAPIWASLALFAGGYGVSFAQTSWRAGRHRRSWFGRAELDLEPNVGLAISGIGLVGFIASFLLPRPAPITIAIAGILLACTLLAVIARVRGWLNPGKYARGRRRRGAKSRKARRAASGDQVGRPA